jgi:transcriptional regulator with PAS, ATPase and Fis domain
MCLNTPDSKTLCPFLHQNGFEVTSTSDVEFALRLINEEHFALILVEATLAKHFTSFIKKHEQINALLLCKNELPFCPYQLGFLGSIPLDQSSSLVCFLKSFFKTLQLKKWQQTDHSSGVDLVAQSPIMVELIEKAKKIAKTQSSVLITGESGTGKEVIAQFIHQESLRASQPFVAINSCAISPQLLEAELFGYEKGAFTGALSKKIGRLEFANHGTFFFDEIGETPLELQAKLLRVIQERSFERVGGLESIKLHIRFIAATNRNLEDAIIQKQFREDLYYRLNVVPLHIPPLKERPEDILPLAHHFIKKYAQKNQLKEAQLSPSACAWLKNYSWPGNIRELFNLIERAYILCCHGIIEESDFLLNPKPIPLTEELNLKQLERQAILKALLKTGGNKTQAAKLLGLSIKTLRAKL